MSTFRKEWEQAQEDSIRFAQEAAVTVRRLPIDEVMASAIREYNAYNEAFIADGYIEPLRLKPSDAHMMRRIRKQSLQYVRHFLTNYDNLWTAVIRQPGEAEAWAIIAVKTYNAIIKAYPALSTETVQARKAVQERAAARVDELRNATFGLSDEEAFTVRVAANTAITLDVSNSHQLKVEAIAHHNKSLPRNDANRVTLECSSRDEINRLRNTIVRFLMKQRSNYTELLHRFLDEPGEGAAWDLIHRQFHRRATDYMPFFRDAIDWAMSEPYGLDYRHYRLMIPKLPNNKSVLIRRLPLELITERAVTAFNSVDVVTSGAVPALNLTGTTLVEKVTRDRVVAIHILSKQTNLKAVLADIAGLSGLTEHERQSVAAVAVQDAFAALKRMYPKLADALDAEQEMYLPAPAQPQEAKGKPSVKPGHGRIDDLSSPQRWAVVVDDVPLKVHRKAILDEMTRAGSTVYSSGDRYNIRLARHILSKGTNQSALMSALDRMPKHLRDEAAPYILGRLTNALCAAYPNLSGEFRKELARRTSQSEPDVRVPAQPEASGTDTGAVRVAATPNMVARKKTAA